MIALSLYFSLVCFWGIKIQYRDRFDKLRSSTQIFSASTIEINPTECTKPINNIYFFPIAFILWCLLFAVSTVYWFVWNIKLTESTRSLVRWRMRRGKCVEGSIKDAVCGKKKQIKEKLQSRWVFFRNEYYQIAFVRHWRQAPIDLQ